MTILLLIRSLHAAGAERQVVNLARLLAARGHDVHLAVYYSGGELEAGLEGSSVSLHDLKKKGRWTLFSFFFRLTRLARRLRPEVIHGYMPTGNILAALVGLLTPGAATVWGVRASDMDHGDYDRTSRLTRTIEARLSRLPRLVIANSRAGAGDCLERGFPKERLTVIENGIDVDFFRPDPQGDTEVRRKFGLGQGPVVGILARLDPKKDHETFLRAASFIIQKRPECRFLLGGGGSEPRLARLRELAGELGLEEKVIFAGQVRETPAFLSALDLAVSSSAYGEGFSNSVAEAMACGVPCAVTRVGDSDLIVGGTGESAPPGDPEALARAALRLLGRLESEPDLGDRARRRVGEHFSLERLAERTEAALAGIAGKKG